MSRTFDVVTSSLSTALFGTAGLFAKPAARQPEKPLELYEFEACPFCRKVRVALSEMDLDAMIFPCPKGGTRFREVVKQRGGKAQFPYLVDPNTGREMYESDDIVRYLAEEYGGIRSVWLALGPATNLLSGLVSLPRATRGARCRAGRAPSVTMGPQAAPSPGATGAPEKPLELYSFEASPYCRLVREALCELELPYLLHNVAKGSPKREAFVERSGKMMVPYLIDPNTRVEMFESADIVRYLNETYGAA